MRHYYVLDGNDITNVVDYDTKEEIIKRYNFKSEKQFYYISNRGKIFRNLYFIQDEESNIDDIPFTKRLFYENKRNGYKYYADINGNFFSISPKNKKHYMKPYIDKKQKRLRIKINRKHFQCAVVIAKLFREEDYKKGSIILFKDNDFKNLRYDNLMFVSKSVYMNKFAMKHPKTLKIGLYDENEKLIKTFDSVRKASKELYLDKGNVSNIIRNKTKQNIYNLKIIEDN